MIEFLAIKCDLKKIFYSVRERKDYLKLCIVVCLEKRCESPGPYHISCDSLCDGFRL